MRKFIFSLLILNSINVFSDEVDYGNGMVNAYFMAFYYYASIDKPVELTSRYAFRVYNDSEEIKYYKATYTLTCGQDYYRSSSVWVMAYPHTFAVNSRELNLRLSMDKKGTFPCYTSTHLDGDNISWDTKDSVNLYVS